MRIAITGGIGEGKSTVLALLRDLGYATDSADEIARKVLSDEDVHSLVSEAVELPLPIDRDALRQALAGSDEKRRRLNEITHPRILSLLLSTEATFIEVPLLLEACLQGHFDQVWVVTCGQEEQRRRLQARYGVDNDVERMIATQIKTRAKEPFADRIIRTDKPPEQVRIALLEFLQTLYSS